MFEIMSHETPPPFFLLTPKFNPGERTSIPIVVYWLSSHNETIVHFMIKAWNFYQY